MHKCIMHDLPVVGDGKNKVIVICAHDPTRKTDAKTLVVAEVGSSMVLVTIMMHDL